MKKFVFIWMIMSYIPLGVIAQTNDDLYFIPKKKENKKEEVVSAKVKDAGNGFSSIVVKDAKGDVRDVDEYNRRYTAYDNTFSLVNDTLYIEEKPYSERGEWVNGFDGSQSDYEYAMRIVRFRNPRYAIPVSSPLYWDVVYTLPSWEWNVFDDGYYAYAFPTYSNPLWWNWRFNYSVSWHSPWCYNSWYGHRYYYGGYWNRWSHPYYHHHYHYPHYVYAGVGGYWGGRHGRFGSSASRPGIHAGRYASYGSRGNSKSDSRRSLVQNNFNGRGESSMGVRQNNGRKNSGGNGVRTSSSRVVKAKDGTLSVRPQPTGEVKNRSTENVDKKKTTGVRSNSVYSRPSQGKGSSYNRASSTRSTVTNQGSYKRKNEAAQRDAYRSNSSSRSSQGSSSYSNRSRSSRSTYSNGGTTSTRSTGGGNSRGGGGGRR